jgi:hypothetical protein
MPLRESRHMKANGLLDELQQLLARINDVPVQLAVTGFHLAERARCAALMGRELAPEEDEQVLLQECGREVDRLGRQDPLTHLVEANIADFCTAMEGVSHFQYLVWSIHCGRQLSLLELELQAEVDKYAVATCLLRAQGRHQLRSRLWRRLFDDVDFVPGLEPGLRHRYEEANRGAARFCQQLERSFLQARRYRPESFLRALREFYRSHHHQKLRRALQ